MFGWYDRLWWYDDLIHVVFGFAFTLTAAVWLSGRVFAHPYTHPALFVLVLVLVGLGIGAVWEILEFAYDHMSGPRNVIQGKFDTVVDLLCDAAGALVAAVIRSRAGSL